METIQKIDTNKKEKRTVGNLNYIGPDFFNRLWDESWSYIRTVVDVAREPILILDKDLRILKANEPFYQIFKTNIQETENKLVYDLSGGEWKIESLRKLLEDILPRQSFFTNYEVTHNFSKIGHKEMILNARQIHFKRDTALEIFPPIILLAFEDITDMMGVAEMLDRHTKLFEVEMKKRTNKLEARIDVLKKKLTALKD